MKKPHGLSKKRHKLPPTPQDSSGVNEQSLSHADMLKKANAFLQAGNLTEAEALYKTLLTIYPQNVGLLNVLGVIQFQKGNAQHAISLLEKAIALNPNNAGTYNNRAAGLSRLKEYNKALSDYDRAIALLPEYAEAYYNRGLCLRELGRHNEAVESYDKAIALNPVYAVAYNNRGNALNDLRKHQEAVESYSKAIAADPNYAQAYYNLGVCLRDIKRCEEAIASFDKAIALDPQYAEAYSGKASTKLLLGAYEEGWKLNEWRWKTKNGLAEVRQFPKRAWLGQESLTGKTIYLYAEQGLGDIIQFCRYIPVVEALCATVIVEIPAALAGLLSTLKCSFQILTENQWIPEFDFHCPLMSLPLAFRTRIETIPSAPYLSAQPEFIHKWQHLLDEKLGTKSVRVGLCWAGGHRPNLLDCVRTDARRSMHFNTLKPLLDVPHISFVSLQLGAPKDQLDDERVVDISAELKNWSDTAAVVSLLDLVITVDTSVCHLAGAMGKKTWLLNRYDTCWRWLLDRDDSPWYPTLTQFRQSTPGDWEGVIARVKAELHSMSSGVSNTPSFDAADAKTQAIKLHQAGKLEEAEMLYQKLFSADPANANAANMIGVIQFQKGNPQAALVWMEKALTLNPNYVEGYNNRANILHHLLRHTEAVADYDRAIALVPAYADAHYNRGVALAALKRHHEATESFDAVLALQPDNSAAYFHRGVSLLESGRYSEALKSFDKAIELDPTQAVVYNSRGNALNCLKRHEEALSSYDKAIALQPDYSEAYSNRGLAQFYLNRYDEALKSFDKAIALKPDSAETYNNYGLTFQRLRRDKDAIQSYDKAIALNPDFANAYYNRGFALYDMLRYDEALENFDKAIALNPSLADAYFGRGFIKLALGEYEEGWKLHEWRWQSTVMSGQAPVLQKPLWLGKESLAGKSILLLAEQGFGDSLQFCRYIPMVAALGAKVIVAAPASLHALFSTLACSAHLVTGKNDLPDFDCYCPLMSLPLAFGTTLTTIPSEPYLAAQPELIEKWKSMLDEKLGTQALRVGLCWAGGQRPDNSVAVSIDSRRSVQFNTLKPLLDVPNTSFVSLQLGPPKDQLDEARVLDISADLKNWADTAAVISLLDLIITVDTSVCHLAGALGKKTWMLNRYDTCWRWMLERNDSPWYPTLTQFRQHIPGDWDSVIARVKAALEVLTHE